jgi:hypothetical protein
VDEAELWIRMLEAVGRHAQACAAELRALRAQTGGADATRDDGHARIDDPAGPGE